MEVEKWAPAHFFCPTASETEPETMNETERKITDSLEHLDPRIELITAEQNGPESLRIFIDHPEGVDLDLCERVTNALSDLLVRYSLEVSSPGADRPLARPEHFRRFAGRKAKVRTEVEIDGRKGFTGTIASVSEASLELELPEGTVTIPIDSIRRSNLVPEAA